VSSFQSGMRIPSSQLNQPRLGNVPTRTPSLGASPIGAAIAAGGRQLGDVLTDFGVAQAKLQQAQAINDWNQHILTEIGAAELRAREADPAQTMEIFDDARNTLGEETGTITNEYVRTAVRTRLDDFSMRTRLDLQRFNVSRMNQKFRADDAELWETRLQEIANARGAVRLQTVLDEQMANSREGLHTAYTTEQLKILEQNYGLQATREHFHALLRNDPKGAMEFLDDPLATRFIDGNERDRKRELARRRLEKQQDEALIRSFNRIRTDIEAMQLSPSTEYPAEELERIVAVGIEELQANPAYDRPGGPLAPTPRSIAREAQVREWLREGDKPEALAELSRFEEEAVQDLRTLTGEDFLAFSEAPQLAIERYAALIEGLTPDMLNEAQAAVMLLDYKQRIAREWGEVLGATDPVAAEGYFTSRSSLAAKYLTGDEIRMKREHWQQKADEDIAGITDVAFLETRQALRDLFTQYQGKPPQAAVEELVGTRARQLQISPGLFVRGETGEPRTATEAEIRMLLLEKPLQAAAATGDREKWLALSRAIQVGGDERATLLVEQSRTALLREEAVMREARDGANRLRSWLLHGAVDAHTLPTDDRSWNEFLQWAGSEGVPRDELITRQLVAGIPLRDAQIKDINRDFAEQTRNVAQGVRTLELINEHGGSVMARNIARGADKTGRAAIAFDITHRMVPGTPEYDAAINTMQQATEVQLEWATEQFYGNGLAPTSSKYKPPLSVETLLANANYQPDTLRLSVKEDFGSAYMFGLLRTLPDNPDATTALNGGVSFAKQWIKDHYLRVTVKQYDGDESVELAPFNFRFDAEQTPRERAAGQASLTAAYESALHDAALQFSEKSGTWTRRDLAKIQVHRSRRMGANVITPIVTHRIDQDSTAQVGELAGVLEFDPRTKLYQIYLPDSPGFAVHEAILNGSMTEDDFRFNAAFDYANFQETGVHSLEEYDLRYAPYPNASMTAKMKARAEMEFIARFDVMPDKKNPQHQEFLWQHVERQALIEHGWPSVYMDKNAKTKLMREQSP